MIVSKNGAISVINIIPNSIPNEVSPLNQQQRMIVISMVHPFPGSSGQQQRVRNKLRAFRDYFHTTFLTVAPGTEEDTVRDQLLALSDDAIVLPSLYRKSHFHRYVHVAESILYAAGSGLKRSNFIIGAIELSPGRVAEAIGDRQFDFAVFEYWHAVAATKVMTRAGARCVLDMHDVLWRSYDRQLCGKRWMPRILRKRLVARYKMREKQAWKKFDALITINREEHRLASEVIGGNATLFYAPMGIDLGSWPYEWAPVEPPRVAFYGGLGSPGNQRDALTCYQKIMPLVWSRAPQTEFWIVGGNPPPRILALTNGDKRVHVTGFVPDVASLLRTMSAVVCPWTGKFGFRSRIVEVQAIGVPVVATSDAVDGMDLRGNLDVFIASTGEEMARAVLTLLEDRELACRLSRSARQRISDLYSFDATYRQLAGDLLAWSSDSKSVRSKRRVNGSDRSVSDVL